VESLIRAVLLPFFERGAGGFLKTGKQILCDIYKWLLNLSQEN
jgi:hypothetical protein